MNKNVREDFCHICFNKYLKHIKKNGNTREKRTIRRWNSKTCSKKCAREYLTWTNRNQRLKKRQRWDSIINNTAKLNLRTIR